MGSRKKAKAVKYTQEEVDQIVLQKKKEFYETQKAYRIKVKQRIMKQLELKHMQVQEKMGEDNIKMQWYGMPMPIDILQASYNLGVEAYANLVNEEKELFDMLTKKYHLEEEDIKGILDGEMVKEVKEAENEETDE